MSLLQSALDFLAGPGSLGGAAGRDQTDFVGQTVELGELRLRVRRVLAEGEAGAGVSGAGGEGSPPGEGHGPGGGSWAGGRVRRVQGWALPCQRRGVRLGRGRLSSRCGTDLRSGRSVALGRRWWAGGRLGSGPRWGRRLGDQKAGVWGRPVRRLGVSRGPTFHSRGRCEAVGLGGASGCRAVSSPFSGA